MQGFYSKNYFLSFSMITLALNEHVAQWDAVTHWCVFNLVLWQTEIKYEVLSFTHTDNTWKFIVGFGLSWNLKGKTKTCQLEEFKRVSMKLTIKKEKKKTASRGSDTP